MNRNKGLTLVETVISVTLFLIAITGILYLFPRGMQALYRAGEQTQVTNLGQEKMEEIRNTPYADIAPGNPAASPAYKNSALSDTAFAGPVQVNRTTTVEPADDPRDGTGAADSDSNIEDYKKIGVMLQWASRGGNHEIQLSTIIANR